MRPASEGEILVTSFHTYGTPLIRYRIRDKIRLADRTDRCTCHWPFPLVAELQGRASEFLWSPERGRINIVNLNNCTKGIEGLVKFQIIQDDPASIIVRVEASERFDSAEQHAFERALRERIGQKMSIAFENVPEIEREASGKFRTLKSSLDPNQLVLEG